MAEGGCPLPAVGVGRRRRVSGSSPYVETIHEPVDGPGRSVRPARRIWLKVRDHVGRAKPLTHPPPPTDPPDRHRGTGPAPRPSSDSRKPPPAGCEVVDVDDMDPERAVLQGRRSHPPPRGGSLDETSLAYRAVLRSISLDRSPRCPHLAADEAHLAMMRSSFTRTAPGLAAGALCSVTGLLRSAEMSAFALLVGALRRFLLNRRRNGPGSNVVFKLPARGAGWVTRALTDPGEAACCGEGRAARWEVDSFSARHHRSISEM